MRDLFSVLLFAALAGAQLNPALTPQKAPQPRLPKIDRNACPFEGCQFGRWTARQPVQLYSTWKAGRRQIRRVRRGESVSAITGIHVTFEPSRIRVTAPIPAYGLKPGDIVL